MLKKFKKYFVANYEKIKLSMSLMLGGLSLIFLLFYLAGLFMHLWEYNVIDLIFNPIAGAIIITIPLFSFIVTLRFLNCYKTRGLFFNIIKRHRNKIRFVLQQDMCSNPDKETRYILQGDYKDKSFRFAYSLGHPLAITLLSDTKNIDTSLIAKAKTRADYFNNFGLVVDVKQPSEPKNLDTIPEKLDSLINRF